MKKDHWCPFSPFSVAFNLDLPWIILPPALFISPSYSVITLAHILHFFLSKECLRMPLFSSSLLSSKCYFHIMNMASMWTKQIVSLGLLTHVRCWVFSDQVLSARPRSNHKRWLRCRPQDGKGNSFLINVRLCSSVSGFKMPFLSGLDLVCDVPCLI